MREGTGTALGLSLAGLTPSIGFGEEKVRLGIGCIGMGGQMDGLIRWANNVGGRIDAICDVDTEQMKKMKETRPEICGNSRVYADYRELLKNEKEIVGVIIATPDHWHAPIIKCAMAAGKHVYCEKPLTHTVSEAREIRELARNRPSLITQTGNQGTSCVTHRRAVDLLLSGALGQVREVIVSMDYAGNAISAATVADPIPEGLNWDFWCGPSVCHAYKTKIYHPFHWRRWNDYGGGVLADFGSHILPTAVVGLKLVDPLRVDVEGEGLGMDGIPTLAQVSWSFPKRGDLEPLTLRYLLGRNGGEPPAKMSEPLKKTFGQMRNGIMFFGEKGTLNMGPWNEDAYLCMNNEEKFMGLQKHPLMETIPNVMPKPTGHMNDWIDGIKSGTQTYASFELGSRLSEICNLGLVACLSKTGFDWNAQSMTTGNPAADAFVKPPVRACGWL